MDFRTEIKPEPGHEGMISHTGPVVLIGSCFTDNIGACMRDELFDVTVNPFGPIYNPASVRRAIETIVDRRHVETDELFEHEGHSHSFLFHSRYSAPTRAEALLKMNSSIESAREALKNADVLIITLGTTRVFCLSGSGDVVANCHKLPPKTFHERQLSLEECVTHLTALTDKARSLNPDVRLLFTVSPLRYLNNGAHANTLSKSTLFLAVDRLMKERGDIYYFPSYEIMMDDLRDYRFYAEDMKHPTLQAVGYIYSIFSDTYYSPSTRELARRCGRFTRRLAHRPLGATPDARSNNAIINEFKRTNPNLSTIVDLYISDGI